ncbi:MAG: outer membrane lipoprotein LolB [Gammaproteobacteria bacterium]|nr:outer membrane lipoprotein LolB [Gammaproteobacteria bacterium]MBU1416335.1 outer membrane lipoprotein LolB [Gammaproteobacteria bacterium]
MAALVLAGCAQLPAENAIRRSPPALTQFELVGRVVVRESQSRHYANIAWRHDAARDEILLTTPLGQGVAELSRDARGARLVTADGKSTVAADWEGLAEEVFGTRLPLNDLPEWLAGHAPSLVSGWRVEYLEYQSDAPDALPTLIEAQRGDIGLRLKVSEWVVAK